MTRLGPCSDILNVARERQRLAEEAEKAANLEGHVPPKDGTFYDILEVEPTATSGTRRKHPWPSVPPPPFRLIRLCTPLSVG